MSKNKTIGNIIFNVSYQILNMIIPLITAPYIARVMGPAVVGVYSYSNTTASYFSVFMLLGVANYGSRSIATSSLDNRSKTFWEIYVFQLFSSFIGIGAFSVMAALNTEYRVALFAQIFYLFSVMLDVSWYFAGTAQFKTTVLRGVGIKLIQTIAIFIFVKTAEDIIIYILIMSIGNLLGSALLWPILIKQIGFSKIKIKGVFSHIKQNLILFLPLLASSVFVYMDKIMLELIDDDISSLGFYEYAEKIVRIPLTIISAIGAVMMPKIASVARNGDTQEIYNYMDVSMRYISLLSVAMCFGLMGIAYDLIPVYLGEEFIDSAGLVQIMCIIIPVSSFANILRTQYLIPLKKDKGYVISIFAGAIVNLVFNLTLIPLYGDAGAAWGTVGAEIAVFVGHIFFVRKKIKLAPYFKEWCISLLIGAIMLTVISITDLFLVSSVFRLIVKFVAGVVVFVVVTLIVLVLRKDVYINHLVRKNSNK